jgi:MFS family permease
LVTVNAPPSERGKALGLTSTAYHVGYMAGPTLGGFIIDAIGWRWIFHLSIPLGLACAYFGWKVLKERARSEERVKVDLAGAAFLLLANICFIYALNQSPHLGCATLSCFVFIVSSAVWFSLSAPNKGRDADLEPSLFRNRLYCAN